MLFSWYTASTKLMACKWANSFISARSMSDSSSRPFLLPQTMMLTALLYFLIHMQCWILSHNIYIILCFVMAMHCQHFTTNILKHSQVIASFLTCQYSSNTSPISSMQSQHLTAPPPPHTLHCAIPTCHKNYSTPQPLTALFLCIHSTFLHTLHLAFVTWHLTALATSHFIPNIWQHLLSQHLGLLLWTFILQLSSLNRSHGAELSDPGDRPRGGSQHPLLRSHLIPYGCRSFLPIPQALLLFCCFRLHPAWNNARLEFVGSVVFSQSIFFFISHSITEDEW